MLFADGYRYLGAKGDIKVCSPFVEKDDEYSTSQVSLLNGSYNDFECVEAGWAVRSNFSLLFLCIKIIVTTSYGITLTYDVIDRSIPGCMEIERLDYSYIGR